MHNLVACYASVAQNSALVNLTPVTDPIVTVQNSRFIFPFDIQIGCVLGNIVTGSRMRINTPSLRNIALPEVYPIKTTAGNGSNPPLFGPTWGELTVPMNDEFGFDVSRAGAAAADCFAGLWYTRSYTPAPSGPVINLRATYSITLTLGTWVAAAMVFDQSLPFGRYAVVGMQNLCTSCMLARLAFPGQTQYRPGVPSGETYGDYINPQLFRSGNFGLFGEFNSTAQPLIECLGYVAGAQTGVAILDLVKIG